MDKATSVIAALRAGKQPSQSQTNAWIEKLLQSELIQVENSVSVGELSQSGKNLARDIRGVLEAYACYGSHKNGRIFASLVSRLVENSFAGENLVQNAIFHLSQAEITASTLDVDVPINSKEASSDYRAIVTSLRTSLQIFWDNATIEGSGVFSDFASFTRLSLADAAEIVADKSSKAAEKLRVVECEVQSGERGTIGVKEQTKKEWQNADARGMFEKSMDVAKDSGSAAIGAAQSTAHKTADLTDRSRTRLYTAFSTVNFCPDPV